MTEPSDPAPPPDVGRLVGERYRLAEVIGVGGMATVHRAQDTRLGRFVAIKLLRREVIADPDIAMRFRREALAATVLRHPNIVACLEAGTDDGQPYLVMEFIEGEDLAARLRRLGHLAPAEVARIGLDVARALGVAHIRGIVHRDVKPGNILLARDGRAMVTDFGIARLAADAEGAIPGTTLGSVHYFSPEQARGATTTAASDVYSLGLVLYEALTGQRAWGGDTTAAIASVRIGADAPSTRAVRPEIPPALDAVVVRALDPDPARRFPSGNALAAALEPIVARPDPSSPTASLDTATLAAGAALASTGALAGTRPHAAAIAAGPGATVAPPLRPTEPPARVGIGVLRRASPAIAGPLFVLVVAAAVVAGGLFLAALPGRDDRTVAAVATATPRLTPKPTPTVRPTPVPTPIATEAPKPTPTPTPTAKRAAGAARDLCDPILGFSCGLGKGTYEPSRFQPPVRFTLGEGWSTSTWGMDLIALGRPEGNLTFASGLTSVYPGAAAQDSPRSARLLVEAFIETDGVAAGRPRADRFDKRKATVIDLSPTGPNRVALFGTSTETYYLEPFGTTRLVVIDARGGPVVVAIEPVQDSTLESLLPTAAKVVDSLRFR
ncbi:MAG: protein kinase [Chloroflexota bacterium]